MVHGTQDRWKPAVQAQSLNKTRSQSIPFLPPSQLPPPPSSPVRSLAPAAAAVVFVAAFSLRFVWKLSVKVGGLISVRNLLSAAAVADCRWRGSDRSSAAMSRSGALDLASGVGGKITKDEVKSAVDEYEKYHGYYGGKEESRKSNYTDMVNKYYDLATSFYEYGWGESFHFAHRWNGESLRESIKRHEHFLALQLGLKPGMKVLDVGCGIGGPLREIAKFSLTSVTGLNNNEYQISRGKELNRLAGVSGTCDFVKVIWDKDLAEDSPVPWYLPLDPSRFSLSSFRLTTVGRAITRTMI
uniref:SAM-dependent methyltransferase Erg6/SMT-type domain-containing protein n=1 Tax=Leersia perrieri TaxID=77586 RepID=A0A0D9WWQ0_9ORYZ